MNEQSRINATISYFFLGPLFLLVRGDTPFSDPFVRGHARRASVIIGVSLVIILIYLFLIQPLITWSLFGISIRSVILTIFMTILSFFLLHGAYRAYHGIDAATSQFTFFQENTLQMEHTHGGYSDEDKVRILASFLPFIGIFTAARYPSPETIIGRKVGSFFAGSLMIVWIFLGSSGSTLAFFITIVGIILFIMTAVSLFLRGEFLTFSVYRFIPTYADIEACIVASLESLSEFFRVAFGGKKSSSFTERFEQKKEFYSRITPPVRDYILPRWIIAIPGLNLITLPSLWQSEQREYHGAILQGLGITILLGLIIFWYSWGSPIALIVLFPISTILALLPTNTALRAPIVSVMTVFSTLWNKGKTRALELKENEESVSFRYEDVQ